MNNYFTFIDGTTAALTPDTKVVLSPEGLDISKLKFDFVSYQRTYDDECYWDFSTYGGVDLSALSVEEVLERCKNGDKSKSHEFNIDTVIFDSNHTYVTVREVRKANSSIAIV